MHEESSDVNDAVYWVDRAAHWAQAVGWIPMIAYAFVRRSMMAISLGDDGLQAVQNAQCAVQIAGTPAYIKGLAAKRMSYGHALAGNRGESARALDLARQFLGRQPREGEERVLGQGSVPGDDLLAIFEMTSDVYLGGGESALRLLEPRLATIATGSERTHVISRAKLVRAYANLGDPGKACCLALETVDRAETVGSLSARSELRRALPVLARWSDRFDVQEVRHRLSVS